MRKPVFFLPFIVFLLTGAGIKAQNPLSLYFLKNVPQSSIINPAMNPRANFFLGFPGLNTIYTGFNTDIMGPYIIQGYNGKYVTLTQADFDYAPFYKQIGDAANLGLYQTYAPLIFGFRTKSGYFTFSWTEKLTESLAIPKDIFSILDKGFPDGSRFDFSTLGTQAQYYREFSMGYSINLMDNLMIGVHAKFLQGLASVKTDVERFDLTTNVDHWDLDMKSAIYLSAPVYVSYDEDGIPTVDSIPTDIKTLINKGLFNFSNPGFAVDVGAVYELNEGWQFSFSVNDLGFIAWRGKDLNTFYADGTYSFEGIYIDNNNADSLDNALDDLLDTIKVAVNFTHGNEHFNTAPGPKLYFGAQYRFNHYFSLGAISRSVFAKNDFRQEFNLSANLNLYHFLTTSLNYTMDIKGIDRLGLGLGLRAGPLQFYVAMDYLPYHFYKKVSIRDPEDPGNPVEIPMMPTSLNNLNVMFGLNLVFGANGFRDKPMIDAYSEF